MSVENLSNITANSYGIRSHSLGLYPNLEPWVCKWEREKVEQKLHIHYNDDFMDNALNVYEKIHIGEFSDDQRNYYEKIKGYLSQIDARIATAHKIRNNPERFRAVLDEITNRLGNEEDE